MKKKKHILFYINSLFLLIFQFVFSQTQLDQFQYNYEHGSNRLTHIDDVIDAANSTVDIDDQVEGNYEYNAIGQLTKDEAEGIENIEWHVNGKVALVTKTDGSAISFTYDAMGNRITKTLTIHNTANGGTGSQLTTIYLRDAIGNLIARYEQENTLNINLKEYSLYGGSQLGTLETEIGQSATASNDSTFTRTLATKNYELKDHLGNVRATVSDVKEPITHNSQPTTFLAQLTTITDYYSYGMQMPCRSYQSNNYKYGYQDKEKDDELKGEGNSYDFGARILDPRVGRWLSIDPLAHQFASKSPYNAMGNDPCNNIDPTGMAEIQADGSFNMEADAMEMEFSIERDAALRSFENELNQSGLNPAYNREKFFAGLETDLSHPTISNDATYANAILFQAYTNQISEITFSPGTSVVIAAQGIVGNYDYEKARAAGTGIDVAVIAFQATRVPNRMTLMSGNDDREVRDAELFKVLNKMPRREYLLFLQDEFQAEMVVLYKSTAGKGLGSFYIYMGGKNGINLALINEIEKMQIIAHTHPYYPLPSSADFNVLYLQRKQNGIRGNIIYYDTMDGHIKTIFTNKGAYLYKYGGNKIFYSRSKIGLILLGLDKL